MRKRQQHQKNKNNNLSLDTVVSSLVCGMNHNNNKKTKITTPLFDAILRCAWEDIQTFLLDGIWPSSFRSDRYSNYGNTSCISSSLLSSQLPPHEQVKQWSTYIDTYDNSNNEVIIVNKQLPIHAAITHLAPLSIIKLLFKLYPQSISIPDNKGNLPIHIAFMTNANDVSSYLLKLYPDSIMIANVDGQLPVECSQYNNSKSNNGGNDDNDDDRSYISMTVQQPETLKKHDKKKKKKSKQKKKKKLEKEEQRNDCNNRNYEDNTDNDNDEDHIYTNMMMMRMMKLEIKQLEQQVAKDEHIIQSAEKEYMKIRYDLERIHNTALKKQQKKKKDGSSKRNHNRHPANRREEHQRLLTLQEMGQQQQQQRQLNFGTRRVGMMDFVEL